MRDRNVHPLLANRFGLGCVVLLAIGTITVGFNTFVHGFRSLQITHAFLETAAAIAPILLLAVVIALTRSRVAIWIRLVALASMLAMIFGVQLLLYLQYFCYTYIWYGEGSRWQREQITESLSRDMGYYSALIGVAFLPIWISVETLANLKFPRNSRTTHGDDKVLQPVTIGAWAFVFMEFFIGVVLLLEACNIGFYATQEFRLRPFFFLGTTHLVLGYAIIKGSRWGWVVFAANMAGWALIFFLSMR